MLPRPALDVALKTILLTSDSGPKARAVALGNLSGPPPGAPLGSPPQALWPGGARLNGQRFTPKGAFECVYIADNGATALAEVGAVLDIPKLGLRAQPHLPMLVLSVQLALRDVLDLTNRSIRRSLATTLTELRAPWRRAQARFHGGTGPEPATQVLGMAAFQSGRIAAVRYPSAQVRGAANLVVFTDRLGLDAANELQVFDPSGRLSQRLP